MVFVSIEDDAGDLTYEDVISSPNRNEWRLAIEREIKSLEKKKCWILLHAPTNSKSITCRFVFKIKKDANGNILMFKARLVAQGFKQIQGINYYETYSLVAKMSTLRTAIAVASINGMRLHHIDVNTAYINADLEEKIFMCAPPGIEIPENHILKLFFKKKHIWIETCRIKLAFVYI